MPSRLAAARPASHGGGSPERGPVHRRGVEEGDHQHRGHVVDDGERGQEHLQTGRGARCDQRQDAEGEGDVGGRGHGPARPGLRGRQQQVQRRRHHDAAQGGREGQGQLPRRRELTDQQLAFDLQADEQEEGRHQPVVHPVASGQLEWTGFGSHDQARVPQRLDGGGPRGIGQRQGNQGRGEQHDAARRFGLDELLEEQPPRPRRWQHVGPK